MNYVYSQHYNSLFNSPGLVQWHMSQYGQMTNEQLSAFRAEALAKFRMGQSGPLNPEFVKYCKLRLDCLNDDQKWKIKEARRDAELAATQNVLMQTQNQGNAWQTQQTQGLQNAQGEIARLQNENAELRNRINELTALLQQKDAGIAALQERLRVLESGN